MPVVINPDSEYGKELAKWNTPRSQFVPGTNNTVRGMKPDGYERYPAMLYKAFKRDNGKHACMENLPQETGYRTADEYHRAVNAADAFTRQCQRTVYSEGEERQAANEGWRTSPKDALDFLEACEKAIGDAAAEAAAAAVRMTPKAQAERKGREAATADHVPA